MQATLRAPFSSSSRPQNTPARLCASWWRGAELIVKDMVYPQQSAGFSTCRAGSMGAGGSQTWRGGRSLCPPAPSGRGGTGSSLFAGGRGASPATSAAARLLLAAVRGTQSHGRARQRSPHCPVTPPLLKPNVRSLHYIRLDPVWKSAWANQHLPRPGLTVSRPCGLPAGQASDRCGWGWQPQGRRPTVGWGEGRVLCLS